MSKVKTDNLKDLKERVAILENEREQARQQHMENQKAIANLEGQLKTYKEIPLKQIAASLSELSISNNRILDALEKGNIISANIRSQHVDNQHVDSLTVEHKEDK